MGQKCTADDDTLDQTFRDVQTKIDAALCDNIDTKTSLEVVKNLISSCNKYMAQLKQSANRMLMKNIAAYITGLFQMFGVIEGKQVIGFPTDSSGSTSANVEDIQMPLLQVLSEFRGAVRQDARLLQANKILEQCDQLRDDILPNLGIRLEDRDNQPAALKFVPREELLKEREDKRLAEEAKLKEKERKKAELAAKEAEKRIPPTEMFKSETDKYSAFDDKGLPTLDQNGKEISKGLTKKLEKLWQAQEKVYNKYTEELSNKMQE